MLHISSSRRGMLSIALNLRTRLGKGQLVVSHRVHVLARESGAESAITDGSIRAESSRRYVASVCHQFHEATPVPPLSSRREALPTTLPTLRFWTTTIQRLSDIRQRASHGCALRHRRCAVPPYAPRAIHRFDGLLIPQRSADVHSKLRPEQHRHHAIPPDCCP